MNLSTILSLLQRPTAILLILATAVFGAPLSLLAQDQPPVPTNEVGATVPTQTLEEADNETEDSANEPPSSENAPLESAIAQSESPLGPMTTGSTVNEEEGGTSYYNNGAVKERVTRHNDSTGKKADELRERFSKDGRPLSSKLTTWDEEGNLLSETILQFDAQGYPKSVTQKSDGSKTEIDLRGVPGMSPSDGHGAPNISGAKIIGINFPHFARDLQDLETRLGIKNLGNQDIKVTAVSSVLVPCTDNAQCWGGLMISFNVTFEIKGIAFKYQGGQLDPDMVSILEQVADLNGNKKLRAIKKLVAALLVPGTTLAAIPPEELVEEPPLPPVTEESTFELPTEKSEVHAIDLAISQFPDVDPETIQVIETRDLTEEDLADETILPENFVGVHSVSLQIGKDGPILTYIGGYDSETLESLAIATQTTLDYLEQAGKGIVGLPAGTLEVIADYLKIEASSITNVTYIPKGAIFCMGTGCASWTGSLAVTATINGEEKHFVGTITGGFFAQPERVPVVVLQGVV